ncbi:MAG: 30S ribosomal protein S19e [Candidatus Bathyarchaeia archaeon]
MPTPYEVPSSRLIDELANYLKNNVDEITPPAWAAYVKTGSHAQRPPQDPDWWFVRSASLLRKIYLKGPIGITHLRSEYGGRKDKGPSPEHGRVGGGSIIRKALQQLEAAGLVGTTKRGRVISPQGRQLLDRLSTEIKRELEKEIPELGKY